MTCIAVIPARMAASRFPGKPLALIAGRPMIEHVYRRTRRCRELADVVIATCDAEIAAAAARFGARAVMTSARHERCTDRVAEAARELSADVIVNVQGDEPLIDPDAIAAVCRALGNEPGVECVNAANRIARDADLENPNQVKVVVDRSGNALYMSRQPIPTGGAGGGALRQLGLIGFRAAFLQRFARLEPTPLERAESVDMLRAIEHGWPVRMLVMSYESIGVDTPSDLARVEELLRADRSEGQPA